jgi:uracil-DNA glycosylase family 4
MMTPKLYKKNLLHELYAQFPHCSSFPTESTGATRVVYGEGNPDASLLLVGEAPGRQEDELGRPFVGRSGQLLTKILEEDGMPRSDVYITNVVKCRPPNNRTPTPQEAAVFKKLLLVPEINIIRPKVILTLGSVALEAILENGAKITKIRGTQQHKNGYIVVPTYHPAYILRNPDELKNFCQDVKLAISLAIKAK